MPSSSAGHEGTQPILSVGDWSQDGKYSRVRVRLVGRLMVQGLEVVGEFEFEKSVAAWRREERLWLLLPACEHHNSLRESKGGVFNGRRQD